MAAGLEQPAGGIQTLHREDIVVEPNARHAELRVGVQQAEDHSVVSSLGQVAECAAGVVDHYPHPLVVVGLLGVMLAPHLYDRAIDVDRVHP